VRAWVVVAVPLRYASISWGVHQGGGDPLVVIQFCFSGIDVALILSKAYCVRAEGRGC
jgi:hypothetical protein